MMRHLIQRLARVGAVLTVLGAASAQTAGAQGTNPFQTVARVNESVVTRFELDQRLAFLDVLRSPGADRESVLDELIDDRLKLAEARRIGATLSRDQLLLGMEEFAARANLSADEFIQAISQAGVDPETFRDFVEAGASWRQIVRARFSARAQVSEEELDRAIALGTGGGNVQVLLSEIVLPLTPETAATSREQAEVIGAMTSIDDFALAAQQVSVAPSRANGGRLDWLPLSQLPPQVAPIFLTLSTGDVSPPVPLPGTQALALFQLRGLRDGRPSPSQNVNLDYMIVRLGEAGLAPAEIARLTPIVTGCNSLYGIYPGADETRLQVVNAPRSETARSAAAVLDTLDPGEMAALPGGAAFVMLCGRTPIMGDDLSRDDVRARLLNRNLEDLAEGYLAEIRANAHIVRP